MIVDSSNEFQAVIQIEVLQVIHQLIFPTHRVIVQESKVQYFEVVSQLVGLDVLDLIVLQSIAVSQDYHGLVLDVPGAVTQHCGDKVLLGLHQEEVLEGLQLRKELLNHAFIMEDYYIVFIQIIVRSTWCGEAVTDLHIGHSH